VPAVAYGKSSRYGRLATSLPRRCLQDGHPASILSRRAGRDSVLSTALPQTAGERNSTTLVCIDGFTYRNFQLVALAPHLGGRPSWRLHTEITDRRGKLLCPLQGRHGVLHAGPASVASLVTTSGWPLRASGPPPKRGARLRCP
jgi:hypothetical protein